MDRKEIERIIKEGESETVEFKKSTAQLRRAAETLCGMLNGHGGRVLIGIDSEGRIIGTAAGDPADHCSQWDFASKGNHGTDGASTGIRNGAR